MLKLAGSVPYFAFMPSLVVIKSKLNNISKFVIMLHQYSDLFLDIIHLLSFSN